MFPNDTVLSNWITMAKDQVQFQGLPSRICWLGYGQRAQFGVKLNKMVSSGELSAPVVIGRDHLDCGSVASPFRETESMLDGSDAVADWPLLNTLLTLQVVLPGFLFIKVVVLEWGFQYMPDKSFALMEARKCL